MGVKAVGSNYAGEAYEVDEVVGKTISKDLYKVRTGIRAPEEGIVHLAIGDIEKNNEGEEAQENIGAIGLELKKANLKTAVIGNADYNNLEHREAALLAMDDLGIVSSGKVSRDLNKEDPNKPLGIATDYERLYQAWEDSYPQADLIVIENGDLARLRTSYALMTEEAYQQEKMESLQKADQFLGRLQADLDLRQTLVIIVSPGASKEDLLENYYLAPIILNSTKEDDQQRGLVTSNSTRRMGIVKNTDVQATIFNFFDIETTKSYAGSPIQIKKADNVEDYLTKESNQIRTTNLLRQPVLSSFVTLIIILIIVAVGLLYFRWAINPLIKNVIRTIILFVLSAPLALLLQPIVVQVGPGLVVVVSVLLLILITGALVYIDQKNNLPLALICFLTSLLIVGDIIIGSPLMRRSILGYSPVIGARFYGLGNEYMGILLGASIIGLTSFLEQGLKSLSIRSKWISSLLLAFVVFVIGYSKLGANIGGTVAAIIGFGITLIWISGVKISWKKIAAILAVALVAIFTLALVDAYLLGGQSSHLGRVFSVAGKGDLQQAYYILLRKISVNMKLIRYTIWSRVILVAIVAFPILLMRSAGITERLRREYPFLIYGISGTSIAALVAFIVNDSGVVAAATTITFAILGLLYIIFKETELYYEEMKD